MHNAMEYYHIYSFNLLRKVNPDKKGSDENDVDQASKRLSEIYILKKIRN